MRLRRPPGPARLPLVGSALSAVGDPLGFLLAFGRDHGGLAYAPIVGRHCYMVSDPALIERVLVGEHRACTKDALTRELVPLLGHGLLTAEGAVWSRQRKLAAPLLTPRHVARHGEGIVGLAMGAIERLPVGQELDVSAALSRLALEVAGRTLLGVETAETCQRVGRALDVVMQCIARRVFSWESVLPARVPTPNMRRFARAIAELDDVVEGLLDDAGGDGPCEDSLLARWKLARDEDGQPLTAQQLRDEAMTMLVAGHDTSALALVYANYLLARHPEAADRLQSEIDLELGTRPPSADCVQRLPYLEAVVRETLRLYPPAYSLGREAVEPFELDGFPIPVGSQLILSPFVVQRDPALFPDPERFSPERWLADGASQLARFAYFPFGGGPRTCIGMHFATLEVALVLACTWQHRRIDVPVDYALELEPAITLRPREPLRATLHQRR